MRRLRLNCLVPLAVAGLGLSWSGPALADEIYGEIRIHNLETGRARPVDRICRIQVRTDNRLLRTTSLPGGRYSIVVAEEGRCTLEIQYRDLTLSAEIGSIYNPARWDLVIETLKGEYRLRPVYVREFRERTFHPKMLGAAAPGARHPM